MERRVLFLSATVGAGHNRASEAIKAALLERDPKIKTLIIDSYRYASAIWGRMAADGYIQMVKFLPQLYGYLYEHGEKDSRVAEHNALYSFKSWVTQLVTHNFRRLLLRFHPHAIVCTHAFPCGIASMLKEEFQIPLIGVVTDFTVHPFWFYKNVDLYSVASQEVKDLLERGGIEPARITVTGIPVDERFSLPTSREEIRGRLGLSADLPALLVMGGGVGIGPIGRILRVLRKMKQPVQVLVVVGTNKRLKKRLETYAKKLNGSTGKSPLREIRVYGFVDHVHELMRCSDLVISKPGGLTSSEALAAELPLIMVNPLPGQEQRNSHYLIKKKVAVMAKKVSSLPRVVSQLLEDPRRMESLRSKARLIRRPDSAQAAAREILKLLNNSSERRICAPEGELFTSQR